MSVSQSLKKSIDEQLTYLFSNGKGEVGLEIGIDAGLDQNAYIQIPKSFIKPWVAKIWKSGLRV